MSFFVTTHAQDNQDGLDPTVYHLGKTGTDHQAIIWPALGFNCLSWRVPHAGQVLDLLYLDPGQFSNGRPTRSGIPVLFPFPNRIRAGHFTWNGRDYQLPCNDGTKANAIHGFACRHPWRVLGHGASDTEAWLTGDFQCSACRSWRAHRWENVPCKCRPGNSGNYRTPCPPVNGAWSMPRAI
jgi:aldose 1-epimerase